MVLKRTAKKERQLKDKPSEVPDRPKPAAYATIPYVAGTTEKISRILKKFDVTTRFNCVEKMGDIIPRPKDRISRHLYEGVYRIDCSCGMAYIGQTGRAVKCRLQEHGRAIKNKQYHLSAVAEHVNSEPGHSTNLERTSVLAREPRYYPRVIREAIEIAKHPNNFNREDGYRLHTAWKRLFKPAGQSEDGEEIGAKQHGDDRPI
jgi:hypothetical protein